METGIHGLQGSVCVLEGVGRGKITRNGCSRYSLLGRRSICGGLDCMERVGPLPFEPHITCIVSNCCFSGSKLGQRSAVTWAKGTGPVLFCCQSSEGMAAFSWGEWGHSCWQMHGWSCPEKKPPWTLSWSVLVWLMTKLLVQRWEPREDSFSFNWIGP